MSRPDGPDRTARESVRALEERWTAYRRALRRDDQFVFDRLFEYAGEHAAAASSLTHRSPLVAAFVAIDLEQERRLDDLEARLDRLEDDLNGFGDPDDLGVDSE